ncbi:hydroxyisourate hydrolase [Roseomonas sp. M0104]|uniref:hydroxyisourate hydrolase n=1 Tax=Teichococcus coralli TaxID=2545983 RepID=A0A845BQU7_9PROT|nr:hydroxyisourate hydrolase [Pseudoroseomonas coralli]MXP65769.1 hydroxyisourate hydrolase [Pseudoroseomonas coralli]
MKPGALTTHVLNTADGCPAEGVAVELWRMAPAPELVTRALTNADGRTDAPLLEAARFQPGRYELRFAIGDYFAARGLTVEVAPAAPAAEFRLLDPLPEPRSVEPAPAERFLDVVVLNVGLGEGQGHYHVPLLCSPWSYSTYRGS